MKIGNFAMIALFIGCGTESSDDTSDNTLQQTQTSTSQQPEDGNDDETYTALEGDNLPDGVTADDIQEVTRRLNEFRAEARSCGSDSFGSAEPVEWHRLLYDAAKRHSDDMAAHSEVGHTGSDDSDPFDRIRDAGYTYTAAAENVAGQMTRFETAFDGWVASSGHCRNMMQPVISQYGIAVTDGYWTLVLATPR